MKYIVDNREVPEAVYNFCSDCFKKNLKFVILEDVCSTRVDSYMDKHPEFDYYINFSKKFAVYYEKDSVEFEEYFENTLRCTRNSVEQLKERYEKSKFRNSMSFEDWYTKNNWEFVHEEHFKFNTFDIPKNLENHDPVDTKYFSETVDNMIAVDKLNELKEKGIEIKYLLREFCKTEIIYLDSCKELETE